MTDAARATARPRIRPSAEPATRHIEVVATRGQRRARPRTVYALIVVGGLFVLLLAQLLLSIGLSDGAYAIQSLQQQQKEPRPHAPGAHRGRRPALVAAEPRAQRAGARHGRERVALLPLARRQHPGHAAGQGRRDDGPHRG
ncbi:hypothetical protein [Clavibacter tessellarius]|uniref:hypothetical protein n=1 Tax=Clavibacter tessellarius TaxID=31965 RepID=UPI003249744C